MVWLKRGIWIAVAAGVLGAIGWAYAPKPVPVELAEVRRGAFELTVTQPGRTRVKDRFVLSAPVGGRLLRIDRHPGDRVARGEVLARMVSLEPPLLDARTRAQAVARVRAAEAAQQQASAQREQVQNLLAFARTEVARQTQLAQSGSSPSRSLELAELDERTRGRELRSAEAALQVASYDLEQARAALGRLTGPARAALETAELRAPIDGAILRIAQESEGPVAAGMPILEVGDLSQLEVVVDLLTQDAVRVQPGAKVAVERWGGPQPLAGRVQLVEPSAFTKLSALGVEEQRVNVVVAVDRPPAQLGDGFRVECRITLLSAADVLQIPAGALFRRETGEWMVFAANGGRLRLRPVSIVEMSDVSAQVASGVAAGDRVVLHPGDKVRDGVRWEPLESLE